MVTTTTVLDSDLGSCDKEHECRREDGSSGRGAHCNPSSAIQPNKDSARQNVFRERGTEGYKMEDDPDLDMICFGPAHPLVRWSSSRPCTLLELKSWDE